MEPDVIPGAVTVEPTVLETIARLTVLGVPGVAGIAERDVDRLLGTAGHSVAVEVHEGRVLVDLHILAGPDQSLLQLGRRVQHEVTRAVRQTIGMPVEAVNVHIDDVVYPPAETWHNDETA